jgi:hypothetical protein
MFMKMFITTNLSLGLSFIFVLCLSACAPSSNKVAVGPVGVKPGNGAHEQWQPLFTSDAGVVYGRGAHPKDAMLVVNGIHLLVNSTTQTNQALSQTQGRDLQEKCQTERQLIYDDYNHDHGSPAMQQHQAFISQDAGFVHLDSDAPQALETARKDAVSHHLKITLKLAPYKVNAILPTDLLTKFETATASGRHRSFQGLVTSLAQGGGTQQMNLAEFCDLLHRDLQVQGHFDVGDKAVKITVGD